MAFYEFSPTLVVILASNLSREERMVQCIADIIQELAIAIDQGKDVNLNKVKTRLASKVGEFRVYSFSTIPTRYSFF